MKKKIYRNIQCNENKTMNSMNSKQMIYRTWKMFNSEGTTFSKTTFVRHS